MARAATLTMEIGSSTGGRAGLEAGARIADRYTIVAPISAGAMGAVYRARDEDGTEIALKRLLDPANAARFEIEGRLLMRLSHPRIVRVHGPVRDGDEQF